MKKNYYLTFGQRYRTEQHPQATELMPIHPDGYLRIRATDEADAREIANVVVGYAWAFLYSELEFLEPHHYTRGEIGVLEWNPDLGPNFVQYTPTEVL